MKKTMIALAAVAAVGAASAQVTLGGEFAYGYLSSTNAAGVTTSGGGRDTAQLVISAKEDLGNGFSAAVSMKLNTGSFGAGASSDDQSLTLTTPIGAASFLIYKPGNWVTGASGGATWYGLDSYNLAARTTRDAMAFTAPLAAGLTATVALLEPSNMLGEGEGNAGTTKQSVYNFAGKYAAGPIVAQAAYLSYTNAGPTDLTADSATRIGATYDLGVAKIGAAMQTAKYSAGATNTETAFSVSAPLGANLTIAGMYATNKTEASATSAQAAANGTRNGYTLQAQYNLSKRTYGIGGTGTYTAAIGDAKDSSFTHLTLVHDF